MKKKAEWMVCLPSKPVYCCDKHANELQVYQGTLGNDVELCPLEDERHECCNCE